MRNENSSIVAPAVVPGGIYTDLEETGVLKGPIYYRLDKILSRRTFNKLVLISSLRNNDVDYRWVGRTNWVYQTTFKPNQDLKSFERIVLNLEGVDTVADVLLNGQLVGRTDNMFAR